MRLSEQNLDHLPAAVDRFAYDRAAQSVGIVHFGIGAFHRAHQAWYTDRAMDGGDRDWAIVGVSLRSGDVAGQMVQQDGLYSVTERAGGRSASRIVGAVRDVLVASSHTERIIALLASSATAIASFTVTEKGYCRAPDGSIDLALAGEDSIYGFLAAGLSRRLEAGLPGLTLLSCDNLAENGRTLESLTAEYCDRHNPGLGRWISSECSFPSTMVDRIVPAPTAGDREAVAAMLGLRDDAAVMTEPFTQWVIEDRFVGDRPRWEAVGAQLVDDVRPYETAKLRMLNGAHSALAYLGLRRGYRFVHEAVADPQIRLLVVSLVREEAATSFIAAPDQDLSDYADAILARFANPGLEHRLAQIAIDGSQKLPQRWLETLAHHQRENRQCPAILTAIAAWLCHVRGDNGIVLDPWADRLSLIWALSREEKVAEVVFGNTGILASEWVPVCADVDFIVRILKNASLKFQ